MNNIWINNEKIKLVGLRYLRGAITVDIPRDLKKKLRYQKLFLVSGDNKYETVDLAGKVGTIAVSPDYDDAFVIVKTNEIKTTKYGEDDIRIIKCFIHYFSGIKPEITEKFCKAIGYNILADYHRAYGLKGLANFKATLFEKNPVKVGKPDALCYGRPRYNILSLVTDFIGTSDLEIFTDPELIGKYKRISRKMEDGSTVMRNRWAKFKGVSGNRTRANISLNTLSKVKVIVPENEHGAEPGERELWAIRSFAVVVDGKLNMEELGFRTSNTKLIGKLKRLGVVEPMLFEGEYVVDLTKLPIFPKRTPISSLQLGIAEYDVRISDIKCKYLSLLCYRLEKKLEELPRKLGSPEEEKSEETIFLESLGIYGDYYYPGRTKTAKSTKTYQTTEIIGKVKGIPDDLYPNLRSYINSGSCKNAVISQALNGMEKLRDEKDLARLKRTLDVNEKVKKDRVKELRALKFRVISGKTLAFSDKQLEHATVDIKGGVKVSWVVRDTEIEV